MSTKVINSTLEAADLSALAKAAQAAPTIREAMIALVADAIDAIASEAKAPSIDGVSVALAPLCVTDDVLVACGLSDAPEAHCESCACARFDPTASREASTDALVKRGLRVVAGHWQGANPLRKAKRGPNAPRTAAQDLPPIGAASTQARYNGIAVPCTIVEGPNGTRIAEATVNGTVIRAAKLSPLINAAIKMIVESRGETYNPETQRDNGWRAFGNVWTMPDGTSWTRPIA